MPYQIAGIDVHKKMLAVVIADVAVDGDTSLSADGWGPVRVNCARWRTGWSSSRSRKW